MHANVKLSLASGSFRRQTETNEEFLRKLLRGCAPQIVAFIRQERRNHCKKELCPEYFKEWQNTSLHANLGGIDTFDS